MTIAIATSGGFAVLADTAEADAGLALAAHIDAAACITAIDCADPFEPLGVRRMTTAHWGGGVWLRRVCEGDGAHHTLLMRLCHVTS